MFEDDESVFAALKAGARGYVLKDADRGMLLEAIRAVARGEALLGPSVARRVLEQFAEALEAVLVRYDNLWQMPFPYVMALHQAPTDGGDYRAHHFHIQLHPPLRKPNLLKYLAGPEVGAGGFISDTSPEEKARELLAVPTTHYALSGSGRGS